jgi:hypothetical protein
MVFLVICLIGFGYALMGVTIKSKPITSGEVISKPHSVIEHKWWIDIKSRDVFGREQTRSLQVTKETYDRVQLGDWYDMYMGQ